MQINHVKAWRWPFALVVMCAMVLFIPGCNQSQEDGAADDAPSQSEPADQPGS